MVAHVLSRLVFIAVLTLSIWSLGAGYLEARDYGQYDRAPDSISRWFKSLRSPGSGVSCCDRADGHLTAYRVVKGRYWVQIQGAWYQVPPERIIRDSGNPTGEGVVFYATIINVPIIFCFVPDDVY
jgi:hypothetical protein